MITTYQKKLSIVLVIALLVASTAFFLIKHQAKKPAGVTATVIPVHVIAVKQQQRPSTVSTSGHLEAIHTASITAKVNGYIQALDFSEGEHVAQGKILIQLQAHSEQDQLAEDNADLKLAELNYQRNEKLIKTAAVSPATIDTLKAAYQKTLATDNGAKVSLANKTLSAPFSGTMGASTLNVGDYVQAGTALVSITDEHTLKVVFNLAAKYINAVHTGQKVILDANHDEAHAKTLAIVSFVSPNISSNTQTFEVHALLNNRQGQFHPGEYVSLTEMLGHAEPVLVIPQRSIVESISGANVYVVKKHKADLIPINLNGTYKNLAVVGRGLSLNQQVITDGIRQVKPGTEVDVKP